MKKLLVAALAALAALHTPAWAAGKLRFVGHVVGVPPPTQAFTIRTTEKKFADLSTSLATMNDASDITIAVTGAAFQADVWLGYNLTDGQSTTVVKRELLDNFVVETSGCAPAAKSVVTLTGYSGANNTGSVITKTAQFTCTAAPPTSWDFGAVSLALHGGYPLHTYYPGATDCTVTSNPTRWTVRSDATNGIYRVVLAGTVNQTPTSPPTAGTSEVVTLSCPSISASPSITMNYIANQADVAPWPATDNNSGTIGSQFVFVLRQNLAYGNVYMLEDGVYNVTNVYAVGFDQNFGPTAIATGAGAPTGPFVGNSWDIQGDTTPSPGWLTIRSRSPLGANVNDLNLNIAQVANRASNPTVAIRLSNVVVRSFTVIDASNSGTNNDFGMADHLLTTDGTNVNLGDNTVRHKGFVAVSNYVLGNLNVNGDDSIVLGNRFSSGVNTQDSFDWLITESNVLTPKSYIAFNLFMNKQGQNSALHEDYMQFRGNDPAYLPPSAGGVVVAKVIGNTWWRGAGRSNTGTPLTGGQLQFAHDHQPGTFQIMKVWGNVGVEMSPQCHQIDGGGTGTDLAYNMCIKDPTIPGGIGGVPDIILGFATQSGSGAGLTVRNNVLQPSALLLDPGLVPTQTGNTFNFDPTASLVNPSLAGSAQSIDDIIAALQPKPGVTITNGPLSDLTRIDIRRHTFNETALAN